MVSIVSISLLVLLLAYPLSIGPLIWYYGQVALGEDRASSISFIGVRNNSASDPSSIFVRNTIVTGFYAPFFYLYVRAEFVRGAMASYLKMWDSVVFPMPDESSP